MRFTDVNDGRALARGRGFRFKTSTWPHEGPAERHPLVSDVRRKLTGRPTAVLHWQALCPCATAKAASWRTVVVGFFLHPRRWVTGEKTPKALLLVWRVHVLGWKPWHLLHHVTKKLYNIWLKFHLHYSGLFFSENWSINVVFLALSAHFFCIIQKAKLLSSRYTPSPISVSNSCKGLNGKHKHLKLIFSQPKLSR